MGPTVSENNLQRGTNCFLSKPSLNKDWDKPDYFFAKAWRPKNWQRHWKFYITLPKFQFKHWLPDMPSCNRDPQRHKNNCRMHHYYQWQQSLHIYFDFDPQGVTTSCHEIHCCHTFAKHALDAEGLVWKQLLGQIRGISMCHGRTEPAGGPSSSTNGKISLWFTIGAEVGLAWARSLKTRLCWIQDCRNVDAPEQITILSVQGSQNW